MCGLNGFFIPVSASDNSVHAIKEMNRALNSRGPDGEGSWQDDNLRLVLGHRRLAIQDLSPAGSQPMHSRCGQYVIVFNGEIYNHLELREQLVKQGINVEWRGHSDTETILACVTVWGIEKTLQATVGMFTIALWDRKSQVLTLARDRMGEKPLYWGWQDDSLYFSSELKGLKAHPKFQPIIDRDSIALLLRYNYIPSPYSIYKGIHKLQAGHWLQLPLKNLKQAKKVKPKAYWRLNDVIESGLANPFSGKPEEAIDLLEDTLMNSINSQMLSDVPLGAFLSGGIDSSTVVALMQAQSLRPVKTFTIGFDNAGYNEAKHAKAVAQCLGTEHTELYVRPEQARAVIPKLSSVYCEPFADSSQIPTFLVSQLAKQQVTVALSGDGGDELFGGYNRYLMAQKVWNNNRKLPKPIRKIIANGLVSLSPNQWDTLFDKFAQVVPENLKLRTPGDKAHKLASVLSINNEHEFYQRLTSFWQDPDSVVIGAKEPSTLITTTNSWPNTDNFQHAMMAMDAQTYMTDDILVKVDRAAMANSLETRVPMLDYRVVELAWQMPIDYKIRNGEGKWLLKQVLYKHVPKKLIERPKMGFGVPLHEWLRGPLREWAEELLDENLLRQQGYFYATPIRQMWYEHLNGTMNHQASLWSILMFQSWLQDQ